MVFAFRFHLRWLFLIVAALGLCLGWCGAQLKWIHDRNNALQWIHPLRARALAVQAGRVPPAKKGSYIKNGETDAPWGLMIFGERGVEQIEIRPAWLETDSSYSLNELQALFPEADVLVAGSQ